MAGHGGAPPPGGTPSATGSAAAPDQSPAQAARAGRASGAGNGRRFRVRGRSAHTLRGNDERPLVHGDALRRRVAAAQESLGEQPGRRLVRRRPVPARWDDRLRDDRAFRRLRMDGHAAPGSAGASGRVGRRAQRRLDRRRQRQRLSLERDDADGGAGSGRDGPHLRERHLEQRRVGRRHGHLPLERQRVGAVVARRRATTCGPSRPTTSGWRAARRMRCTSTARRGPATPLTDFGLFTIWADGTQAYAGGEGEALFHFVGGTWTTLQGRGGSSQGFVDIGGSARISSRSATATW